MKSNMKSLFFLLPALLLSLASCNTNTSTTSSNGSSTSSSTSSSSQSSSSSSVKPTDPTIETALASLKQNNHTVDIDFTVRVLHPKDEYAVDIEIHRQEQRSFSYNVLEDKSIEKGYHVEGSSTNCDLDKETGDYVETTRRVYPITPLTIFEDTENGLAVMETLNVQNEVDYAYLSEYDADTGVYDPVVFDTDYINPWDYINAEDFSYDSDGILHLDLEKAEFLAESYGASSVNWATDCTVSLNSSNQIAKVDFTIPDIEGENFERVSKMTLLYSDFGKETVNHLAPLTNDNPHLATALKCLLNAKNFTVSDSYDKDDNEIMTLAEAPAQADDEIKAHSITVSSGTVTVNKSLNVNGVDFEVASGATVMVTGKGAELTTEGATDNDKLTVDGTLTVSDAGMVDVGTLTVKGTFNVIPADAEQKTADGEATIETLLVGIEIDDKTKGYVNATAASVSANAIDGLGVIVVSAESTVTGELIDNEEYTEFYVEDTLWITVYNMGGAGNIITYNDVTKKCVYGYAPTDLPTSEFVGWKDSEGKLITGQTIAVGAPNYDKVYADIDYNVYKVAITLDNTVGSVAIDGQMLIYQNGVYVLPGGQELTAGQHTVTYTLSANYEGTPTLSSQNVTVSGLTFTLDGDFKDSEGDPITYYLSLGGATLADQTVVIEGGNGGNGELGLTDYLLIILVILIVVMAIIVAMRLMRS